MVTSFAAGCSGDGDSSSANQGKINVMTSFYPLYDFAQQIGGEHVEVSNMIPAGIDPHDWSPKSQDIVKLTKSKLFVYNGAGFDDWWVNDLLKSLGNGSRPYIVVASDHINLIPAGGEEDPHHHAHEGSSDDHSHDHDHAHEASSNDYDHAHEHDHGEYDPHIWLSPRNAIIMAENIMNGLIEVDPEHQTDYEANFLLLKQDLEQLDAEYHTVISKADRKEFVTSHQAFAYLARDYGLTQLAVMGLSTDAEPTSQALKNISDIITEHQIRYILLEELAAPKIAETLAHDLGIDILTLNPIEGLTKQQESDGENYISLMRHNLQSLELALQE